MPRKSSTLDEAVMLIQILTRIPKGRLITAQQLKQELDAAGIPIRIRTLQRYLKTMASTDVFGIDCDMRSRPTATSRARRTARSSRNRCPCTNACS